MLGKSNSLALRGAATIGLAIAGFLTPGIRADDTEAMVSFQGYSYERCVALGEKEVCMLGRATYTYWRFKVYDAILYAEPGLNSGDEILGPTPKRLILRYARKVAVEDIQKATEVALNKNPEIDIAALRDDLDALHARFKPVDKGDTYRLDYIPGEGSEFFLNDKSLGVIEGEEFARAYFGIWISQYPLDESKRDLLLGR